MTRKVLTIRLPVDLLVTSSMFNILLFLALHPAQLVAAEAGTTPKVQPGCSNPRVDNGNVVADCVDEETGRPFLYVDNLGEFNDLYRARSESAELVAGDEPGDRPSGAAAIDIATQIFEHWSDASNTTKRSLSGRYSRAHYHEEKRSEGIQLEELRIDEGLVQDTERWMQLPFAQEFVENAQTPTPSELEAGRSGSIKLSAKSISGICTRLKCSNGHAINWKKMKPWKWKTKNKVIGTASVLTVGLAAATLAYTIIRDNGKRATEQSDTGASQDVCTYIKGDGGGKICVSYASKNSPMIWNEKIWVETIKSCIKNCMGDGDGSCQFVLHSKTQHNQHQERQLSFEVLPFLAL